MSTRLEHANLAVRDFDGAVRFLTTAFPDFGVRAEGIWEGTLRWAHVGNADSYVAFVEAGEGAPAKPYTGRPGLNRTRVYFHDAEGNDWEFVEYRSSDPERRNDSSLDGQTAEEGGNAR